MRVLFVHRHRWSHEKRRAQLKRELKEGNVILRETQRDWFVYEVPDGFRLAELI